MARSGTILSQLSGGVEPRSNYSIFHSLRECWLGFLLSIFLSTCAMFNIGFLYGSSNTAVQGYRRFVNKSLTDMGGGTVPDSDTVDIVWSTCFTVFNGGVMLGTIFVAPIAENCGRKGVLAAGCLMEIVGNCLCITSVHLGIVWLLGLGRIAMGAGNGLGSNGLTLFLQECPPTEVRGFVSALQNGLLAFGGFLGAVAGTFLVDHLPYLMAINFIPDVLYFLAMPFIYDTPKHLLLTKENVAAAEKSIRQYRGASQDMEEAKRLILAEHSVELRDESESDSVSANSAVNQHQHQHSQHGYWRRLGDVAAVPHLRRAAIVGLASFLTFSLLGTYAVTAFSTLLFLKTGMSNTMAQWGTVGSMALSSVCAFAASYLIDKFGRRTMLIGGGLLVELSLVAFVVPAQIQLLWPDTSAVTAAIGALALIVYSALIMLGPCPVAWFFTAEMCPQQHRSTILTAVNNVGNCIGLVYALMAVPLYDWMGRWGPCSFLIIYVLPGVLQACFMYKYMPETNGVEVQDIVRQLKGEALDTSQSDSDNVERGGNVNRAFDDADP